jgi:hypothetical protein
LVCFAAAGAAPGQNDSMDSSSCVSMLRSSDGSGMYYYNKKSSLHP